MPKENSNFMHQTEEVEVGYFEKRRGQFHDAIRRGIGGSGRPKTTTAKPKARARTATPPPTDTETEAPRKGAKKAPAKSKTSGFGAGPKDLSKLPKGLQNYWKKKRREGK